MQYAVERFSIADTKPFHPFGNCKFTLQYEAPVPVRHRAILPHPFLSFEEVLPHTIAGSAEMYTRHSFTAATPLTTFEHCQQDRSMFQHRTETVDLFSWR